MSKITFACNDMSHGFGEVHLVQRVCCFGNILRGDDGVGPRIALALRQRADLRDVEVLDLGTDSLALAGWLADGMRTVLVDAWRGPGPAGEIRMHEADALMAEAADAGISHGADLRFALRAAQTELGKLPPLQAVTVTITDLAPFRIGLSPAVEQAIPRAVAAIMRLLDQEEETPRASRSIEQNPGPFLDNREH